MLQDFAYARRLASGEAPSGRDDEALRRAEVRLERVFEVQSPAGDHLVTYVEADFGYAPPVASELIGQWIDPAITKHHQGLGFTFPLRTGTGSAIRAFAEQAFHHRRFEHHVSRRRLGLTREQLWLQGDLLVFYLEGDHPRDAYEEFAGSTSVHDIWLRSQLRELFSEGFELESPLPAIRTVSDRELVLA